MKKEILRLMLSVATGILFFSCSQTDVNTTNYDEGFIPMIEKSIEEIAEEVFISSEKLADLSPEQLHGLRVDWVLQQNMHVEGLEYIMDITPEEALKLGVTREEYENYINEFRDLTKKFYAAKKAGHIVVPLDPKKACANRKEMYFNKNTQEISRSDQSGGLSINTLDGNKKQHDSTMYSIMKNRGYTQFTLGTPVLPTSYARSHPFEISVVVCDAPVISVTAAVAYDGGPYEFAVEQPLTGLGTNKVSLRGAGYVTCFWEQVYNTSFRVYRESVGF